MLQDLSENELDSYGAEQILGAFRINDTVVIMKLTGIHILHDDVYVLYVLYHCNSTMYNLVLFSSPFLYLFSFFVIYSCNLAF